MVESALLLLDRVLRFTTLPNTLVTSPFIHLSCFASCLFRGVTDIKVHSFLSSFTLFDPLKPLVKTPIEVDSSNIQTPKSVDRSTRRVSTCAERIAIRHVMSLRDSYLFVALLNVFGQTLKNVGVAS